MLSRSASKETYPSWGFSIRHGATTIWERWDGWTPERGFQSANMNSFNHYAYGAVGEWIWSRLAGIDWDENAPGYQGILFRPLPDARIGHCHAVYDAPTGRVESHWHFETPQTVRWKVVVPPNCTARMALSAGWGMGDTASTLSSGTHEFLLRRQG